MKTNCIGVAELLCAYADGELEKSKIHIVEDHLLICENCSAILKLYREISTAIDDTNVPAPEILRPGVMNRIQHEEIYTDTEKVKKRKQYHFILTRFAPVAACLIIGLVIWQPWRNYLDMSSESAMPAAPMAEPAFDLMQIAPDSDASDFGVSPEDTSIAIDADTGGDAAGGNSLVDDDFESDGFYRIFTDQDNELLQEHINGAYAEIIITGELPALLESYMPQAFGPWFEWDIVFEIPSTEIPVLLDELENREEFTINRNEQNANSLYVMVFFSFGD
ncbi:MAG: zf-HC2 domain-containing protein [Oscillospiraceae bacterium]|nr:zf-HC2 domain-containing protein [Oscillospiraceae bacterium]